MKSKTLTNITLAGLLTVCLAAPGLAGTGDTNIFKSRDKKQTAKDFKPAPDKIKTSFGTLAFEGGAFPTEKSVQKIYDELDLQRATQVYMDFFPSLSIYGIVNSQVRDFGFKTSSALGVMADFMQPSENYLTGNDVTVYAFASLDLKVDGATVVEIPPGEQEAFLEEKRRCFREILEIRPYPGASRVVAELRERFRLALVTGSDAQTVRLLLDAHLYRCVETIVTGDTVARTKPAPDPWLAAARQLGLSPAECLVVENAPLGIEAARAAGMRCIAVRSTLGAEWLSGADSIVPGIGRVPGHPLLAPRPGGRGISS